MTRLINVRKTRSLKRSLSSARLLCLSIRIELHKDGKVMRMNSWRIIKKFIFLKVPSYTFLILLVLLALLVVPILLYDSHCEQRIRSTKYNLIKVRSWIPDFKLYKGRYPDSIKELRKYVAEERKNRSLELIYIDFKKNKQSIVTEFDSLNDKGGYYYDKTTGEVKINLTKPVKHYLKFYFGINRNKIPSDW